jgi:hypothetical protein
MLPSAQRGCDAAEDRLQALEAIEQWLSPADIAISVLNLRGGERGLDVCRPRRQLPARRRRQALRAVADHRRNRIERLNEIIAAGIPLLHNPLSPQRLRTALISAWTAANSDR